MNAPNGARSGQHWIAQHSRSVIFLILTLGLLGIYLAFTIPVSVFPATNFPRVLIAVDNGVMPIDQMTVTVTRPIEEAISSGGGVRLEALDAKLMLNALPGVFCAGEMLDWEAPTGGYLLTACLATGRAAGLGAAAWLKAR